MKKMIAITLAAILLLSVLTACGANNAANSEVAGTWTGVYTKYVGDPTKMDETFSLELKADGTGVHHRDDMDFDVKWKLDGENFSMTESFLGTIEYTGTLTGDTLSIFNGDPTNDFTYNYVYTKGDAAETQDAAQEANSEAAAALVGTWSYSDDYVYTFNADGTGNYKVGTTDMPFTYTDNGTAVAITFEGNTAPMELNYTIDGSKLTITDSFGEPVVYDKK